MSKTKNLIQLISSTEKSEFDKVIKAYLKFEYGYTKIVITDGKDDTGIDIKVFDYNGQKLQFQLTTQKSKTQVEKRAFEAKLRADIEKAKENFESYRYSNKLIFFYSYALTNKKVRDYEKMAFKDYGIILELIDANRLAEESEEIIEIQRILYNFSELDKYKISNSAFDDDKENLIFDLLSFGKPSEFKLQVIEAFILKTLFSNKSLTKSEMISHCEEKFRVQENNVFYDKLLSRLQTNKKIKKSIDRTSFILTSNEESILKTKIEQFDINEKLFIKDIATILETHNQIEYLEEYILQLKELYSNNFSIELRELLQQTEKRPIYSIIGGFSDFIKEKSNGTNGENLAIELLKYCIDSKFIQKIAASKVYIENINNSRLENYLATQKKVFIDTPIAIYSLCYFYKPTSLYNNYFYKITKNLIEYAKSESMPLYISERYIWEIQNHIKEAYYLIPFSRIDNFSKLGTSRNVFYNYYLYLLNNDYFEEKVEFSQFLNEFGFNLNSSGRSINAKIEYYLNQLMISQHIHEKEYDIDETNRIFEEKLLKNNKSKPPFVRNNDSIMIEFLADNDVDIHPLNPVFLTWDKTFFDVQSEYINRFPQAQNWLTIPPGKLIDSYSILKFSIDNETVTENLLALISDELVPNTHSLIDTIKSILNPENEVSLEYTNKLAEIRAKEINAVSKDISTSHVEIGEEAVIDRVFFKLTHYYQDKEEKQFSLFKEIFTKREHMDEVLEAISNAIESFNKSKIIEDSLFSFFDKIIDNEKSV